MPTGIETPAPIDASNVMHNVMQPANFATQQLGLIGAFLPQVLLAGGLAYFAVKGLKTIGGGLGLTKEK